MRWIFTNWLFSFLLFGWGVCGTLFWVLLCVFFFTKLKSEFLLFSLQPPPPTIPCFYVIFFFISCFFFFFVFHFFLPVDVCVFFCEFTRIYIFLRALGLNCACARTFNSFGARNKENEIRQNITQLNKIVWQIVAGAEIRFQARR